MKDTLGTVGILFTITFLFPFSAHASVVISEVAWPRQPSRAWCRGKMGLLLGLTLFVMPSITNASVVISEVAWMGNESNANAEWIELYNNGEEVDLTGWTLEAVDGQPSIELSGILAGGAYALLERTSDDTVPTVEAYLVYTGSLSNAGELLELRNKEGVLVHSVDGSDEWAIGGSNETKKTLQRSGDPPLGAWTTGTPSPRGDPYQQSTVEVAEDAETESTQNTVSAGDIIYGESKKEEKRERLQPALQLDVGSERTVIVGVPSRFTAHAYSERGRALEDVLVNWNFGDGQTAHGKEVDHTFLHEGDYVVSVTGERKNFIQDISDKEQIVVHVVPSPVHITDVSPNYITLKNDSNKMLEISDCILVSGSNHFKIPKETYILGNASITLPKTVTGIIGQRDVTLFNETGMALSEKQIETPKYSAPRVAGAYTTSQKEESRETLAVSDTDSDTTPSFEAEEQFTEETQDTLLAVAGAKAGNSEEAGQLWWWILALVTVIVTAIIAIILVRREQEEVIEGYYIESRKTE